MAPAPQTEWTWLPDIRRQSTSVKVIAVIVGCALALPVFLLELSLGLFICPDAQSGIGIGIAMIIGAVTAAVGALVTMWLFRVRWQWVRAAGIVLLLCWLVVNVRKAEKLQALADALTTAANPRASQAELDDLYDIDASYWRYELDNRLAGNVNSSRELLWHLFAKGQLGTNVALARNPNAPPELLLELAKSSEPLVIKSLARNPTYVRIKAEGEKDGARPQKP